MPEGPDRMAQTADRLGQDPRSGLRKLRRNLRRQGRAAFGGVGLGEYSGGRSICSYPFLCTWTPGL